MAKFIRNLQKKEENIKKITKPIHDLLIKTTRQYLNFKILANKSLVLTEIMKYLHSKIPQEDLISKLNNKEKRIKIVFMDENSPKMTLRSIINSAISFSIFSKLENPDFRDIKNNFISALATELDKFLNHPSLKVNDEILKTMINENQTLKDLCNYCALAQSNQPTLLINNKPNSFFIQENTQTLDDLYLEKE